MRPYINNQLSYVPLKLIMTYQFTLIILVSLKLAILNLMPFDSPSTSPYRLRSRTTFGIAQGTLLVFKFYSRVPRLSSFARDIRLLRVVAIRVRNKRTRMKTMSGVPPRGTESNGDPTGNRTLITRLRT